MNYSRRLAARLPVRIFRTLIEPLINTGALARWKDAHSTWEPFQQFVESCRKPLKRLIRNSTSLHRAKAPVLMTTCWNAYGVCGPGAALLLASGEVVTAPDAAAEKLKFTMENSEDAELAMVARLRLARVLAYRDRQQEALALLNVAEPGQFAGRIAEIKGDIHAARGETDAARTAYLEAMVAPGAELLDRGFLQMKLSDLPGSAPAAAAPSASPDAGANPAAAPAEAAQTAPAKPAEGA